jgi:arrestin-related trafficking adapter 4/5/7
VFKAKKRKNNANHDESHRWDRTATQTMRGGKFWHDDAFYNNDWTFGVNDKNKNGELPTGNHEFPFSLVIPGNMAESVEGLDDSWIVYRMKATIERGRLSKNISARKHLRIVRTSDVDDLSLTHGMVSSH